MSFAKILFIALAFLPLIATLIPFSKNSHWTTRGFDFPRFQMLVCLVTVFLVHLLAFHENVFDTALLVLVASAAGWQAYSIFPFTPLASKHVLDSKTPHPDNTVSFVVSNVLQTNRNAEGLLEIIARTDPDIILTLETDHWWEKQLSTLEQEYAYSCKCPQDNLYGMHLYSRLPLKNTKIDYLVEDHVPSMMAKVQMRSGHFVSLYCLHPAPPSPTENEESIERDAELLIVGKSVGASENSAIVTGDLNDVAWSGTTTLFRKMSGLLDPRMGRGMFSTYNAKFWFLRWPLDHLFHSNDFTLVSIGTLPHFGSDHFPIHVTLHHEPGKQKEQEAPEPDKEDIKIAQEKIDEGTQD